MMHIVLSPAWGRWLPLGLTLLVALSGCAGPKCTQISGFSPTTPATAAAGDGGLGERVRWGGSLAGVRHLSDATELKVLAYPLDSCGRPRLDASPIGRFILLRPGFVETAGRPEGSLVSSSGLIVGRRDGRVGEAEYSFPVLQGDSLNWWRLTSGETRGAARPWITIGIGGGSYGYGGGVGVHF